jgi:hypothetical protein
MSALEEEILETFYGDLSNNEKVTPKMLEQLKAHLTAENKLKPEELVKIFSPAPEEDLK